MTRVALVQSDAPNAGCVTTHGTHVLLGKEDGHALLRGQDHPVRTRGAEDGDELVALVPN